MRLRLGLTLLVILLVGGVIAAFAIQNLHELIELELNVGFTRFSTQAPIAVPWLLFGTFGGGFLVGILMMVGRVVASSRWINDLELQLNSRPSRGSDWE